MLILMLACTVSVETEQDFTIAYAQSQCRAYKQCHRSLFDGEYVTMPECEEEVQESFWEELTSLYEGCTYNSERAMECINLINTSTCGELWSEKDNIHESCQADVWNCS